MNGEDQIKTTCLTAAKRVFDQIILKYNNLISMIAWRIGHFHSIKNGSLL